MSDLHLHVKTEYFEAIKRGWTLKTITHPHFGPDPVTVFAIKLEK